MGKHVNGKVPEKMENTRRRAYVLGVEADELLTMILLLTADVADAVYGTETERLPEYG
jgi:hypothetical protein